jgi:hypothetical protein
MKLTIKTDRVQVWTDIPYSGEASMFFETYFTEKAPRVIEFPKVVRVEGKQYAITDCSYRCWGDRPHSAIKVRVPKGAKFDDIDNLCNVEYY